MKEAAKQAGTDVKDISDDALAAFQRYPWPGNVRELRNAIERAVVLAEAKEIQLEDLGERFTQPQAAPVTDDGGASDYREAVRKYEIQLILQALHKANGNQTEAAKALGLPLRTFVHKIQTYGIKKKFGE